MDNLNIALENLDIAIKNLELNHIVCESDISLEGIGTTIRSFSEKIKNLFSTKRPNAPSTEMIPENKLSHRQKIRTNKIDKYVYDKREEWVSQMTKFFPLAYRHINQFEMIPLTISFSTITDQNDNDPAQDNPIAFRKFTWMYYISAISKDGKHLYIPLSDQSQMYNQSDASLKKEFDDMYENISHSMLNVLSALNMIDDNDPDKKKSEFGSQFNHNASGITVTATFLHERTDDGGIRCRLYSSQLDILRRFTYAQLENEAYDLDNESFNKMLNMNKKYIDQMFNK